MVPDDIQQIVQKENDELAREIDKIKNEKFILKMKPIYNKRYEDYQNTF